jgi:hypothetical protein
MVSALLESLITILDDHLLEVLKLSKDFLNIAFVC